jgi:hypothetical protein
MSKCCTHDCDEGRACQLRHMALHRDDRLVEETDPALDLVIDVALPVALLVVACAIAMACGWIPALPFN